MPDNGHSATWLGTALSCLGIVVGIYAASHPEQRQLLAFFAALFFLAALVSFIKAWTISRRRDEAIAPLPHVEDGLTCEWWVLANKIEHYAHGIHVRVTTKKRVSRGIRITCDRPIHEAHDAMAETTGIEAVEGGVSNFPGSRERPSMSWLFTPLSNYPSTRHLRLDVDLLSTEEIKPVRIETIKPGEKLIPES